MITVITDLRFEASLARKLKNSRIEKDLCVTNSHYVIHMADKKTEIVPFYCVSRIFDEGNKVCSTGKSMYKQMT